VSFDIALPKCADTPIVDFLEVWSESVLVPMCTARAYYGEDEGSPTTPADLGHFTPGIAGNSAGQAK
jgi:hypothetical protein